MLKSNFSNSNFEAGVDEVGRGSLAGPITAAAVILPKDYRNDKLNDSKKLSEKKRLEISMIIKRHSNFNIGVSNNIEIDRYTLKTKWQTNF